MKINFLEGELMVCFGTDSQEHGKSVNDVTENRQVFEKTSNI